MSKCVFAARRKKTNESKSLNHLLESNQTRSAEYFNSPNYPNDYNDNYDQVRDSFKIL